MANRKLSLPPNFDLIFLGQGLRQQGHHHNGDDVLNLWSPIYDPSVWTTWDRDELIR